MPRKLKCRVVCDSIFLFEVRMPGGYVSISGFHPLEHPELMEHMEKVEEPVKHLFRYEDDEDEDRTWTIYYRGEVDETLLDRLLPVSWWRKAEINHLFTLHDDFGFYLEDMTKDTPAIQKAREINKQLVDILVNISMDMTPVKRWDQLTTDDVQKAFLYFEKDVCEIEEHQTMKRVLQVFLHDRNKLNDIEKRIVEEWYSAWYDAEKTKF